MTKKKKQPKNAFYFFMRDYKEEQEQKGVRFPNGMKDVAEMAAPVWKELRAVDKAYYEHRAAEEKRREKGNLENKYTTTGVSYAELERQERERMIAETRMREEIEGTVQGLDRATTLRTKVFHFIHFNYYCRLENGHYIVCEVALAEFNLEEGVRDVYHTIIRNEVPLGYSFEAAKTSEETHRIPVPPLTFGEEYKGELFLKLKNFMDRCKRGSILPPLYTLPSHIEVAQTTLNHLAERHYPQNPDIFRVYPVTKLFFELRNACSRPGQKAFPVMHLAERELEKDLYNFAPGISCQVHEGGDACVYCSRSIVHRWGFLICDHCCKDIDITIIPGHHVPINAEVRKDNPHARPERPKGDQVVAWQSPKKADPQPVKFIDYSKIAPKETRVINVSAAGGSIVPPVRAGESCWGPRKQVELPPLRRPMAPSAALTGTLPSTSKNDFPNLTNDDFPALGRGRPVGLGRAPDIPGPSGEAFGRGRGRGGLIDPLDFARVPVAVSTRGRGTTRLAANFGALSLDD